MTEPHRNHMGDQGVGRADHRNGGREMIWYHGSDQKLTKLNRGSWVTDKKPIAKTFGKYVYIVDIEDDSIDFDILYSLWSVPHD